MHATPYGPPSLPSSFMPAQTPQSPWSSPGALPYQDHHKLATLCYIMDICHPVHQLLDARTRQLFTTLEQTISTHIDPWRGYLRDTSTAPPPPGLTPPSTSYRDAIDSAITTTTEDLVDIYTTFISSHIQPLAHVEHGKHFAVSPRDSSATLHTPPTNTHAASPVATFWTSALTSSNWTPWSQT